MHPRREGIKWSLCGEELRPSLRINLSNSKHTPKSEKRKAGLAASTHPGDCVSGRAAGLSPAAQPFAAQRVPGLKDLEHPQSEGESCSRLAPSVSLVRWVLQVWEKAE